ncbi:MAG: hypothetical protein DWQ47_13545 [Acidobacteria bacterium]|nr:MAG: hypothetical protein DWQ32_00945 [Acidobacteriota bacterium]REK02902.1 MAG: hypothetical protein DWQ38_11190 [Acidobacteriota bacterium]REK13294.1 MAG: hypothetical protein DWQ43_06635 [Acidobacteriota bacterium]REK41288.1 MAG: hypothetical protein DWQ47_13545 [Acidobacteriota bacterium]
MNKGSQIRAAVEKGGERKKFVEGVDFYYEGGLMVLTEKFLLDRGYCCGNGCRHCPYPENKFQPRRK